MTDETLWHEGPRRFGQFSGSLARETAWPYREVHGPLPKVHRTDAAGQTKARRIGARYRSRSKRRSINMYDGRGTAAHVRSRRSVLPTVSKTFAIEMPMVGWESHCQSGAPSGYTQLRTGSVALAYCHFRSWAPIVQSPGAAAVTAF